ncbi:MAG: hypothetical protein Q8N28_02440 [bacterium]|nr:hypothetical protein [bacterium]
MEIKIIKNPINKKELVEIAKDFYMEVQDVSLRDTMKIVILKYLL